MHSLLRSVPSPPLRTGFWAGFKLRCFGTGWLVAVTAWLGCTLPAVVLAMNSVPVPGTPSPCSVTGDAYPASAAHAPLHTVLPGIAVRHPHWPSLDTNSRPHWVSSVVLWQGHQAVVLDPGATHCSGLELQSAMLRLAGQPLQVSLLINSHAHAEQVLANHAWQAPVAALAGTQMAMQQRCADCLAALTQDLGEPALRGTRIKLPEQVLEHGQLVQAGGRHWQVLEMPMAHTQSDLLLWSADDAVLLAGGLIDGHRLVLAQGRVVGWLQALAHMEALQPRWLIGQHLVAGPGQVQAAIGQQREALCDLVRRSWQGLESWQTEAEVLAQAPTQGSAADRLLARFNLGRAWREMEALWLGQEAMPQACAGSGAR
jgi:glyoxylase-like metal-dependent hydrolase (beta-lactamase superfamily II)